MPTVNDPNKADMRQESIQICKGTINIPLQDARDSQPECSLDSDSEGRKQCSTRVQKALYSELYKIVRRFCPPLTLISKIPSQQALKHIWEHGRIPTFRLFAQERSRGESLTNVASPSSYHGAHPLL